MKTVTTILIVVIVLGFGYWLFSRYLVSKLDGSGVRIEQIRTYV
ncbi:MAG: hypothetical protein AAB407_03705 [Patescibacteria group bacterium]